MVKKALLRKVPPEFYNWVERRRDNMERMVGLPIKISKMDAMRIIAETDGVNVTNEMLRKIKRK